MTQDLYLTRAAISRAASASALAGLLAPQNPDARMSATHRLIWTLFADGTERTRDFLWRDDDRGRFYILSQRPPQDNHALFDLDPPKVFAPSLRPGDKLAFSLRANPTISRKNEAGKRIRCDVVMDGLSKVPRVQRASVRHDVEAAAGRDWLNRQGAAHGFRSLQTDCVRYDVLRPPHRANRMRLGVLELEGVLEITDPFAFLAKLAQGFGRARAYGCGLMLIRRA